MEEKKIIMYDEPGIATKVLMVLADQPILYGPDCIEIGNATPNAIAAQWLSPDGRLFNGEDMARFHSCTHVLCSCGNVMKKNRSLCEQCKAKEDHGRWLILPHRDWDEISPVYDQISGCYFLCADDLVEAMEDDMEDDKDVFPAKMRLVLCNPVRVSHVLFEHLFDDTTEDGVVIPEGLEEEIVKLNKFIDTLPVIAWEPGYIRTEFTWSGFKKKHT